MTICKCGRPMVIEHTSKKEFCIPCRLPGRKERYTTPLRMTDKPEAEIKKQNEYYRRNKVK